jgi:hypothetical protein
MVPPGPAQTEGFMKRLLEHSGVPQGEITSLVEDRRDRQEELFRRIHAGTLAVLLSEAVMRNGCDQEQINRLIELDELANVTIKYLPLANGPYRMLSVPFSALSFRNPEEPGIVYLERPYERRFYENSDAVGRYHQTYEEGLRAVKSPKEFQQ